MGRIALRSFAVLLGSALVGSLLVFGLLRLLRGDIAWVIAGQDAPVEAVQELRDELGLDRPWFVQYVDWLGGLVRGDLGQSYASGYDIAEQIRIRMGLTLSLAVLSLLLSLAFAIAVGTYAALHSGDGRGRALDLTAQLGISIPTFWIGMLLISFISIRMGWLPAGGYVSWREDPVGAIRSLILPVLTLSVHLGAVLTRYVRSAMLDILNEDYIRSAMAKGRTFGSAVATHGIRNGAVPVLTVGVLALGSLLTGVAVVEVVFSLPGLGRMLLDAVLSREVIVVQSLVFIFILMILVLNFLMDLAYGLLDPRIRDKRSVA
ncbi:ABC transporter permease [Jiangella asiatica]|uniref:ABC transporter permease n=1 Tax=Jiangella asiatica TaxID=2530372 RepID=A0A4V2Z3W4_9ACTN|nr:ABC transporter permease [Jiangella asiatica]TDE14288.1 ABC transporter permease [Jiangella asiatica]